MTTLGGQTFAKRFAQTYFAVNAGATFPRRSRSLKPRWAAPARPTAPATPVAPPQWPAKNTTAIKNTAVSDLWTALYKAPGWTLRRSMISATARTRPAQPGLHLHRERRPTATATTTRCSSPTDRATSTGSPATSNFTWGRALGTGTTSQATSSNTALDNYNLQNNYGLQSFDIKFVYNIAMYYAPKVYSEPEGRARPSARRLDLLAAVHGAERRPALVRPIAKAAARDCQAFGEVSTTSSATTAFSTNARRPPRIPAAARRTTTSQHRLRRRRHQQPDGCQHVRRSGRRCSAEFRKCILGFDGNCGGFAMRDRPALERRPRRHKSVMTFRKVWAPTSASSSPT